VGARGALKLKGIVLVMRGKGVEVAWRGEGALSKIVEVSKVTSGFMVCRIRLISEGLFIPVCLCKFRGVSYIVIVGVH
jgi:hypothetical protein